VVPPPDARTSETGLRTASWPRRILALFVDWTACNLVLIAVMSLDWWSGSRAAGLYTTGLFILESTVLTALVGGSFGKMATGLRVVRVDGDGRPLDLLQSLLRVVLVCLVVPPLVYKPDGRGLHDLAVGSAAVPVGGQGPAG
jgi:uncharacterized RDD family membrane protein YckC